MQSSFNADQSQTPQCPVRSPGPSTAEGSETAEGSVGGWLCLRPTGPDDDGRRALMMTAEVARAALDMGFYISFSGILTFKNAQDLRDVASFVPR